MFGSFIYAGVTYAGAIGGYADDVAATQFEPNTPQGGLVVDLEEGSTV